jgi:hypothetical protein
VPRGNPDNLRAAAQRKRQAATQRAETALDALIATGEPITFRGLARTAGVSIDFLYRSPLRARIEQLRASQQCTPPVRAAPEPEVDQPTVESSVVRALTRQLAELKRRHRDEITRLEAARRCPRREPTATTQARTTSRLTAQ